MVVLDTDGLAKQDKEALDLKTLAADTPEVISRQATINIGTIGLSLTENQPLSKQFQANLQFDTRMS